MNEIGILKYTPLIVAISTWLYVVGVAVKWMWGH